MMNHRMSSEAPIDKTATLKPPPPFVVSADSAVTATSNFTKVNEPLWMESAPLIDGQNVADPTG
jgi:hypothetical protein